MDLRIKKTKRAIRSAFYELIKEKPLEKITVREIAERAEINKTTFYAHYETVYDLVDQLEQEAVAEVISQLNTVQGLLSSPRAFVREMYAMLILSKTALYRPHFLREIFSFAVYGKDIFRFLV